MHSMTQSNFFLNKTATIDKINKNIIAHNIAMCPCQSPRRLHIYIYICACSLMCVVPVKPERDTLVSLKIRACKAFLYIG